MELSGTIYRLSEAQDISEKFRKREVVIKTDDQYPQTIPVEFVQDRIDLLNSYSEGQQVTISINIRGREWTSPKGEVKFFVSVQGWRIQPLQQGSAAASATAAATSASNASTTETNVTNITGSIAWKYTFDSSTTMADPGTGEVRFDNTGLAYGSTNEQRYVINDANPSSARAEYRADFTFVRDCWNVRTESELIVTCDENDFFLVGKIAAYEDGSQVFTRDWNFKIPRLVH